MRFCLYTCLLTALLLIAFGVHAESTKVRLLLKWDHQFQFAGYYAAHWKGYYKQEGIEVEFIPRPNPDQTLKNIAALMEERQAEFAAGGPDILIHVDQGKPFLLLASIFQRSPFSYVILDDSPIKSLSDIYQSCIGVSRDFGQLEIQAVFLKEGYDISKIQFDDYGFALSTLLSGRCDVSVDYRVSAEWASHEKKTPIRQFFAESYGINFYGDTLFTHKELAENNPELVEAFRRASIKGWQYALDNKEEISRSITEQLNRVFPFQNLLQYNLKSAEVIQKLMNYPIVHVGHSSAERWRRTHQHLKDLGMVAGDFQYEEFLFDYEKIRSKAQARYLLVLGVVLFLVIAGAVYFIFSGYVKRRMENLNHRKTEKILETLLSEKSDSVWEWYSKENSLYVGGNWFGVAGKGVASRYGDWMMILRHVIDRDKLKVQRFIEQVQSKEIHASVTFRVSVTKERTIGYLMRVSHIQEIENHFSVVGVLMDVSQDFKKQQELEDQNSLLDSQIKKKTVELEDRNKELYESKIMLQGILNLTPLSIYWKDLESCYMGGNLRFVKDAGLSSVDELIGLTDDDLPWKNIAEDYRAADKLVISEQASIPFFEDCQPRANGSSVWMRATKIPLKNSQGDIIGVLGMNEDISSARSAYQDIQEQKEKIDELYGHLRSIVDSSPDMIFLKDYSKGQGTYLVCNQYFEEWVGKPEYDLIGKIDAEIFPSEDVAWLKHEDEEVIRTRMARHKELTLKLASGRAAKFDFSIVPVANMSGEIHGVMGIARDITSTSEFERIYKTLFDVSYDGYLILDSDGAVSKCNKAALDMLGVNRESSVIGLKPVRDLSPPLQIDGVASADRLIEINERLDREHQIVFNWTHKRLSGEPFTVEVVLSRLNEIDDYKGKARLLAQWHDIEKRIAREVELERAKQKAEELAALKSMFLANMSHEVRTPLNAIVGLARLLSINKNEASREMYIQNINYAASHLMLIVSDILDYSKLDANKVELEEVCIDLQLMITNCVELFREKAEEKGIDLIAEFNLDNNYILADETRLKQIFTNLISNAIKFTAVGGVKIEAKTIEKNMLQVDVIDTGIGIPEASQRELFNPFIQADVTTTRRYGGTGLGLAICDSLVQLMNGRISVQSKLGQGTTFSVILPVTWVDETEIQSQDVCPLDMRGKRILVAEDNKMNQLVVTEILKETHAEIIVVDNGRIAVDKVFSESFDLVLMDIQMPVMDGYEATQLIRSKAEFQWLPIIALTANNEQVEKERAIEMGLTDYLTKPIDHNILYATINKILKE